MLKDILRNQIFESGDMDLYTYMSLCQYHPEFGYYSTKASILGGQGDFITSPEITSLFGEITAIWVMQKWMDLGCPPKLFLVELGPGRGHWMEDILRTLKGFKSFSAEVEVFLYEVNPNFKVSQIEKISPFATVHHVESLEKISGAPIVIIANEFLDALPVRQYKVEDGAWKKRCISCGDNGDLVFKWNPTDDYPAPLSAVGIVEVQPDVEMYIKKITNLLSRNTGASLWIDYGYWEGSADSLQAVYRHKAFDPLIYPGESDLSVHVCFKNIADIAEHEGFSYKYQTQREFLVEHGIQLRVEHVKASSTDIEAVVGGAHRLISPQQMGNLFKVIQLWKM
jgi:NADH dehydrogenase [ubiquinone] 1 alpha subcomplex assembly factor 7